MSDRVDLVSLHVCVFHLEGKLIAGAQIMLRGKVLATEAKDFEITDETAACNHARELMLRMALRLQQGGTFQ